MIRCDKSYGDNFCLIPTIIWRYLLFCFQISHVKMLGVRVAAGIRIVCPKSLVRNASGPTLLTCYHTPQQNRSGPYIPPTGRISFSSLTVHVRHASSITGSDDAGSPGWYASIADSNLVHLTEQLLISSQGGTALPWWASIMCTTLALRTVITLPLGAYQMIVIGKVRPRRVPSMFQNMLLNIVHLISSYLGT